MKCQPAFVARSRHDLRFDCSEMFRGYLNFDSPSEVLDAEGSSRHVPVGFSDGAAPKGIGSCKKVVTFLIYTVMHFFIICCIGLYTIRYIFMNEYN